MLFTLSEFILSEVEGAAGFTPQNSSEFYSVYTLKFVRILKCYLILNRHCLVSTSLMC